MHAELCPKCNGQKIVSTPPWVNGDVMEWTSGGTSSYPCPVCGGKGYIEVNDSPSFMGQGYNGNFVYADNICSPGELALKACSDNHADFIRDTE